jgi:hypothetical protein
MKMGALGGGFGGVSAEFHMTGGELSNTASTAVAIGPGVWTFTGVTFTQNRDFIIYLQDGSLVMRGCTVTGNGGGVDVFVDSTADLGTNDSPGNNVFQNTGVGVTVESNIGVGGIAVQAVGNIWNPSVQGADTNGTYATAATITGPVTAPPTGTTPSTTGADCCVDASTTSVLAVHRRPEARTTATAWSIATAIFCQGGGRGWLRSTVKPRGIGGCYRAPGATSGSGLQVRLLRYALEIA